MIGEWNVFDCSSPVTASLLSSAVPKIVPPESRYWIKTLS